MNSLGASYVFIVGQYCLTEARGEWCISKGKSPEKHVSQKLPYHSFCVLVMHACLHIANLRMSAPFLRLTLLIDSQELTFFIFFCSESHLTY